MLQLYLVNTTIPVSWCSPDSSRTRKKITRRAERVGIILPTYILLFHSKAINERLRIDEVVHSAYTESINLMDYSAAVIPVTRADQEIDLQDNSYEPLNEKDRKNWEACKAFSLSLSLYMPSSNFKPFLLPILFATPSTVFTCF
jgi:hypothetical protein